MEVQHWETLRGKGCCMGKWEGGAWGSRCRPQGPGVEQNQSSFLSLHKNIDMEGPRVPRML